MFPAPLKPPTAYEAARSARKRELITAVLRGISVRGVIILAELLGFYLFASFSLLFDALASLVDIASSLVLLIGIRFAERPPDEEHPFGHGRYEPLAGFQLSLLMIGGAFLAFQQFFSAFVSTAELVIHPWAWVIPFLAVILLEFSYHVMNYVAKKNHSPALRADAVHFRIDAASSLLACCALLLGAYAPLYSHLFDHLGAMLIAIFMVAIGVNAARSNFYQLSDRAPDPQFFEMIRTAARSVSGVMETEKLRIQLVGPDAHVDIDIEVDPDLKVDAAHRISQEVRVAIQEVWPAVRDVIVHIEPYYPNDHN